MNSQAKFSIDHRVYLYRMRIEPNLIKSAVSSTMEPLSVNVQYADFTEVAAYYKYKFHYSPTVIDALCRIFAPSHPEGQVADLGAGTGELTVALAARGLAGVAVEPNASMRHEGERRMADSAAFAWRAGSAERTGLADQSVDWVLYGGSFHWTKKAAALAEARRILRPGGRLTAIWTMRDLARDPFQYSIDRLIEDFIPNVQRVYHGIERLQARLVDVLQADGLFGQCLAMEGHHDEETSTEAYLGMWRMVHDVRSQSSPSGFDALLDAIEARARQRDDHRLFYRTRAWTVRKVS